MEPYYGAQDIPGHSLVANYTVGLKRLPLDSAATFYSVNAGQSVGNVFSYLIPGPGRTNLYWMFNDNNGQPYYAEHVPGRFSIAALTAQGVLSSMDKVLAEQKKNETLADKIERNIKWIVGGVLGVSLAVGIAKAYFSKK